MVILLWCNIKSLRVSSLNCTFFRISTFDAKRTHLLLPNKVLGASQKFVPFGKLILGPPYAIILARWLYISVSIDFSLFPKIWQKFWNFWGFEVSPWACGLNKIFQKMFDLDFARLQFKPLFPLFRVLWGLWNDYMGQF